MHICFIELLFFLELSTTLVVVVALIISTLAKLISIFSLSTDDHASYSITASGADFVVLLFLLLLLSFFFYQNA